MRIRHAHRRAGGAKHPYSLLGVALSALVTLCVPLLALLGYGRSAVIWLGVEVLAFCAVRLMRPEGTWIAARGRTFDVIFGVVLAILLLSLSWYAKLPAVVP